MSGTGASIEEQRPVEEEEEEEILSVAPVAAVNHGSLCRKSA